MIPRCSLPAPPEAASSAPAFDANRAARLLLGGLLAWSVLTTTGAAQTTRTKRIEQQVTELETGFGHKQTEAADALLLVDPSSVEPALRKRIAKAFRTAVLEGSGHDKGPAVQGLVHWAGRYSTPVLIEVIHEARLQIDPAVFDALVELDDPEGAEAVAGLLGNFFNHDAAVEALKRMGPTAEPVVINAAKSRPGKMSMGAIEVLGEIGASKGLATLTRLSKRGPAQQRSAAKLAASRLRGRIDSVEPEAPPSADSDDPFADPAGNEAAGSIGSHPEEGDWSQVERPLPDRPQSGAFQPDPAPADAEARRVRFKPARLAESRAGTIDLPVAVCAAMNDPTRVVVVTRGHMGDRPAKAQLLDLRAGKARRTVDLPPDTMQAALSPSGKRLATLSEEGMHGARMRIDIWELAHSEPKLLDSWRPFTKEDKIFSADPMWAAWSDEDHLLMQNRAGDLVVWDAVGAVARVQLEVEGWTQPVLSPGGRQVAAVTPDGVVVYDTATGDTLAWIEDSPQQGAALGFDPTGQRLACINGTRVRVWNLVTGETTSDFNLKDLAQPGIDFKPAVGFVGDDRLVIRGRGAIDLVDLTQRRILVRGEHQARCGGGAGGVSLLAYVGANRSALYPETAPDADKRPSPEVDPDDLLAIGPGSKVALDVRVGGGLDESVRELLTQRIADAGLVLDPNATNKFVARKETKSEMVTYRGFHTPHWIDDGKQVNVNEHIYTITLFVDGEPAWRFMTQQRAQHMLRSQQGESFQEASDRQMQASASYYNGADLPRRLVHPDEAGPLQTVKLRGG